MNKINIFQIRRYQQPITMKIEDKLSLICILFFTCLRIKSAESGNPDAKRLYDDLLSNYNKLVRPVSNVTEAVTVYLKLKLSQLIAVVREIFSL